MPKTTTGLGMLLLLGTAAIRLFWLTGHGPVASPPTYYQAYLAVVAFVAVVAAVAMAVPRFAVPMAGWALGTVVSLATLGMYLASRIAGLPQLPVLVDRFDYALGTFAMGLAALFIALHASIVLRINIAVPQVRDWHD
jgi:hypothetical protein